MVQVGGPESSIRPDAEWSCSGQDDYQLVHRSNGRDSVESVARPEPKFNSDITRCFLRLANLDNGGFERFGRYKTALSRQVYQVIFSARRIVVQRFLPCSARSGEAARRQHCSRAIHRNRSPIDTPSTRTTPAGDRLLPRRRAATAPASITSLPLGSSAPAIPFLVRRHGHGSFLDCGLSIFPRRRFWVWSLISRFRDLLSSFLVAGRGVLEPPAGDESFRSEVLGHEVGMLTQAIALDLERQRGAGGDRAARWRRSGTAKSTFTSRHSIRSERIANT